MRKVNVDHLAPRYLIRVEGTKLKADVTQFIRGVEYHEDEDSASRISLTVANPRFRFLESKIFAEGNRVDLWMGYVGRPLRFQNRGIIVRPNPLFPRGGMPVLNVVAHDVSRKLMEPGEGDKGKLYRKKRDSDIASEIFREIEAAPFVYETRAIQTRVRKRGVSKWEFLRRLARLHNFVVFTRYDPTRNVTYGFFGPPDQEDQPRKYSFVYGSGEPDATCLEFYPDLSLASQETELTLVYTDPKKRKTYSLQLKVRGKTAEVTKFSGVSGTRELKKEIRNGTEVQLTVFGQRAEVVPGKRFSSVREAKRWAAAWWARRESEFAFATGTVLGEADLRRGQVHAFRGLGNRLSGDWQLTSVTQRQDGRSLFESSFSARKVVLASVVGAPDSVSNVRREEAAQ